MRSLNPYALSLSAASALLVACGGSQPPIGAPGAMPQGRAIAQHAAHGGSWMLPEAKKQDLLYVGDQEGHVYIFSYPNGIKMGTLDVAPYAMCPDSAGDIFMTKIVGSSSEIIEYAHGGTTPIATLGDPGFAHGCSVDPATGNLAVTNFTSGSNLGGVVIYQNAQGTPQSFTDANFYTYAFCGYDSAGNLFINGSGPGPSYVFKLAELPAGASTFTDFTLDVGSVIPGSAQWDGSYVAMGTYGAKRIDQVTVSGSEAHVVHVIHLRGLKKPAYQYWIQGSTILTASGANRKGLGFWKYPTGGRAFKTIKGFLQPKAWVNSVTVSLAPR